MVMAFKVAMLLLKQKYATKASDHGRTPTAQKRTCVDEKMIADFIQYGLI